MRLDRIPPKVLEGVRKAGFVDEEIKEMAAQTLFNEFCRYWFGMPVCAEVLWDAVVGLMMNS